MKNFQVENILQLENISKSFGGLKAIDSLSCKVRDSDIFSIIGPNGAGKTTVFNIISGFYKPDLGNVYFQNTNIVKLPPHERAKIGIGRTFQNLELFSSMNVLENILIAKHLSTNTNIWGEMFSSKKTVIEESKNIREIKEVLKYLNLIKFSNTLVSNLPYPLQKRVELARALAINPKILLLDEPAAGLNLFETKELCGLLKKIRSNFNITILIVEHNMSMVMNISDTICVLNFGIKIAEDKPIPIQKNKKVIEAYLGKGNL